MALKKRKAIRGNAKTKAKTTKRGAGALSRKGGVKGAAGGTKGGG